MNLEKWLSDIEDRAIKAACTDGAVDAGATKLLAVDVPALIANVRRLTYNIDNKRLCELVERLNNENKNLLLENTKIRKYIVDLLLRSLNDLDSAPGAESE